MARPLNAALTVLAKSAAAYLVRFHGVDPTEGWWITTTCLQSADDQIDPQELECIFGEIGPLDDGLYILAKPWRCGDWCAVYFVKELMVLLEFTDRRLSDLEGRREILRTFAGCDWMEYRGEDLLGMVGHNWCGHQVQYVDLWTPGQAPPGSEG